MCFENMTIRSPVSVQKWNILLTSFGLIYAVIAVPASNQVSGESEVIGNEAETTNVPEKIRNEKRLEKYSERKARQDEDDDDDAVTGAEILGSPALSTLAEIYNVIPNMVTLVTLFSSSVNQRLNDTDTPSIGSFLFGQGVNAVQLFQMLTGMSQGNDKPQIPGSGGLPIPGGGKLPVPNESGGLETPGNGIPHPGNPALSAAVSVPQLSPSAMLALSSLAQLRPSGGNIATGGSINGRRPPPPGFLEKLQAFFTATTTTTTPRTNYVEDYPTEKARQPIITTTRTTTTSTTNAPYSNYDEYDTWTKPTEEQTFFGNIPVNVKVAEDASLWNIYNKIPAPPESFQPYEIPTSTKRIIPVQQITLNSSTGPSRDNLGPSPDLRTQSDKIRRPLAEIVKMLANYNKQPMKEQTERTPEVKIPTKKNITRSSIKVTTTFKPTSHAIPASASSSEPTTTTRTPMMNMNAVISGSVHKLNPKFKPGKPAFWMNMYYPNGIPVLTKMRKKEENALVKKLKNLAFLRNQ